MMMVFGVAIVGMFTICSLLEVYARIRCCLDVTLPRQSRSSVVKHEHDDPIDAQQLASAVRHIAERYRTGECGLNDLVEGGLMSVFFGCVVRPQVSTDRSLREGLIAEIKKIGRAHA